jgi:hypothetical protein
MLNPCCIQREKRSHPYTERRKTNPCLIRGEDSDPCCIQKEVIPPVYREIRIKEAIPPLNGERVKSIIPLNGN